MVTFKSYKTVICLIVMIVIATTSGLANIKKIDAESALQIEKKISQPDSILGIGGLGQIEPRSRVINVTHNNTQDGGTRIETLFCNEGDFVKKNDLLAVLGDNKKRKAELVAIKANDAALKAKLSAENIVSGFNEKEYKRYEQLLKTSAVSKSVVDQKWLAYEQSKMLIKQLQAEIAHNHADQAVAEANLANTKITAPIQGTILKIHNRSGELVGNEGLLEMADLSILDVVAEVYESDIPKVKIGQLAKIRLTGFQKPIAAKVLELGFMVKKNDLNDTDPLADRDNRIIEVRLSLENDAIQALQHQIYRQVQVQIAK